jgi:hypothetical protein
VEAEDLNEVRTGRAIRSPLTAAAPTIVGSRHRKKKNIAQRRSHSICQPSPVLAREPAGQNRSRGAVGRRRLIHLRSEALYQPTGGGPRRNRRPINDLKGIIGAFPARDVQGHKASAG